MTRVSKTSLMQIFVPVILFLATAFPLAAQTAEEIMASVRQVAGLQDHIDLHGHLKHRGKKIPLSLLLRGKEIHFNIDEGADAFALRLNANQQELFDTTGGKVQPFPDKKIVQAIGGTDVSYEDLALKFLYWPNPTIAGENTIKTKACWRIHVANPDKTGRYREVSVWVSKKERALMRVIGYGARPQAVALKQFEVLDVTKRKGIWTVKKLSVSSFKPNGRADGVTYIDFGKKRKGSRKRKR